MAAPPDRDALLPCVPLNTKVPVRRHDNVSGLNDSVQIGRTLLERLILFLQPLDKHVGDSELELSKKLCGLTQAAWIACADLRVATERGKEVDGIRGKALNSSIRIEGL